MNTVAASARARFEPAAVGATAPARRPGVGPDAVPDVPRRDHLRVVREERGRRISPRAATVIGVAGLFAAFFALVVFQTMLVQNQARLDQVDVQVREEQARYQVLRLQVAQLSAPDRIVAEATALGMVPPPGTTYLTPTGSAVEGTGTGSPSGERTARTDENATSDWSTIKPELGAAR